MLRTTGLPRPASRRRQAGGEGTRGEQAPPPQVRPGELPPWPATGDIARGAQPSHGGTDARERQGPRTVREEPPPGPRSPARPAGRQAGADLAASSFDKPARTPGPDGGSAAQPRIPPPQGAAASAPLPVTGASWAKELDALPGFKAAVDAGLLAIMGAYNRLRSQWCCQNDCLLNQILKTE